MARSQLLSSRVPRTPTPGSVRVGGVLAVEDADKAGRRQTKVFSSMLADARRILGLAREPAAEAVVRFQITDLPLVGHGILQDADQAHSHRWPRVILEFIELSCELVG